jgi:hypothetical protein
MPSQTQSVLFMKRYWTKKRAVAWLNTHGYIHPKVDITEHYLRFRQQDPKLFKRMRMQQITPSIKLVLGF